MRKTCFVSLFFIVFVHRFSEAQNQAGVFFCTRDLHPDIYIKSHEAGKTLTSSSTAVFSSASIIYSAPVSGGILLRAGLGIAGGYVAMRSSEYIYDLYMKGFLQISKDLLRESSASVGSFSRTSGDFVKVQDKNLNNEEVSTYRHCSLLLAEYKLSERDGYIQLGRHRHTNGFFQAPATNNNIPLGSSRNEAIEESDPIQESTVCTKVLDIHELSTYKTIKAQIDDIYMDSVDKGYSLSSNNCCSVAYDVVKRIGGDTGAIDASNFNHKIGIENNGISFIVKSLEYLAWAGTSVSESGSKQGDKEL